jgi:hypothetical protein
MFDEAGADTKIGSAKRHYHDRFQDQQPCNPRALHLRGAVWFETAEKMLECEGKLKEGGVFPKTDLRFIHREWYRVGWSDALAHGIWAEHGGEVREVAAFKKAFRDDLNAGDVGDRYLLHAYVLSEEGSDLYVKLRLSAYGWEAARQTYLTGNPHNLVLFGRWRWRDNAMARAAGRAIFDEFARNQLHYGWHRMPPANLVASLEKSGAVLAPRRAFDLGEADTKGGRIPLVVSS